MFFALLPRMTLETLASGPPARSPSTFVDTGDDERTPLTTLKTVAHDAAAHKKQGASGSGCRQVGRPVVSSRISAMSHVLGGASPDAQAQSRSTKSASWVAAVAAIIAAVLALLSSVTTVVLSDRGRQSDFVRSQQQELYSKVLADLSTLEDAEQAPFEFAPPTASQATKAITNFNKVLSVVVEEDWSAIQIVASDKTMRAYSQVRGSHLSVRQDLLKMLRLDLFRAQQKGSLTERQTVDQTKANDDLERHQDDAAAKRRDLLDAFRSDIRD